MPTFFDLLKYAKTGIASPEMTHYDKLKALALCGGGLSPYTIIGQPPISFLSDGTPLTSVTIKGNGVQNGTPSPQNILPFDGTGERTGNVMPFAAAQTITSNGITFESDGKGGYTIKGYSTAAASAVFRLSDTFTIPNSVGNGGNGTLSFWNTKADSVSFGFMFNDTVIDEWSMNAVNRKHNTYRGIANQKCNAIKLYVGASKSCDQKIQPEFTDNGEYPTEFEPYGYKIPLACASVTTPLYLGEQQTVRRIKRLELDGTEDWQFGSSDENRTVCDMKFTGANTSVVGKCSYIDWKASYESTEYNRVVLDSYQGGRLFVSMTKDLVGSSVNAFKQYLAAQYAAGTPVTVWYVLAEPETGIVNEPLYRIGDYADTLTTTTPIPTAKGSNALTVDTTVQPSEVSITGNIKPTT